MGHLNVLEQKWAAVRALNNMLRRRSWPISRPRLTAHRSPIRVYIHPERWGDVLRSHGSCKVLDFAPPRMAKVSAVMIQPPPCPKRNKVRFARSVVSMLGS